MTHDELQQAFIAISRHLNGNEAECLNALSDGGEYPITVVHVEIEGGRLRRIELSKLPKRVDISYKINLMPRGVVLSLHTSFVYIGDIVYLSEPNNEEYIAQDKIISISISEQTVAVNGIFGKLVEKGKARKARK